MRYIILVFLITNLQWVYTQQYDNVYIEKDSININNKIFRPGTVFIYDFEIKKGDKSFSLIQLPKKNSFKLTEVEEDSVVNNEIHLAVNYELPDYNKDQTKISYYERPVLQPFSSTGAVENDKNVWIHPIRTGFFKSLETCPFPYIKKPFIKGNKWKDQMLIGENWSHEFWGEWEGKLLLNYQYSIIDQQILNTPLGKLNCFVIKSTATSKKGETELISYFSEQYGFVKLEYKLITGIIINMSLGNIQFNKKFKSFEEFYKTNEYIKD
ncbi:hypothetical protein NBT05_06255 [Aquimarina sp. ERC-38]|uniref:hypothetical protein n=1 Tax=Aquimarina sp. ERC-38 TaxID=2949996 RepID=UPI002246507A|nr:hypothetical protein [Aquimarina sp. ERC-38]UZO82070.1 hypothetical protein NBT05_06255 [Aquimarina sp. ERC-38]